MSREAIGKAEHKARCDSDTEVQYFWRLNREKRAKKDRTHFLVIFFPRSKNDVKIVSYRFFSEKTSLVQPAKANKSGFATL